MVVLEKDRKEESAMISTYKEELECLQETACCILHKLRFRVHLLGYQELLVLLPEYTCDSTQSLSKELYPKVANQFGHTSWKAVEHAVRVAILDAWERRDPEVWENYFPGTVKVPSNKQFLATLAEHIKKAPPG